MIVADSTKTTPARRGGVTSGDDSRPQPRACPECGSHDTSTTAVACGVEEIACNTCGTISSCQIVTAPPGQPWP